MKKRIKTISIIICLIMVFTAIPFNAFAAESEICEVNITMPTPQAGAEIFDHDEIILDNDNCRVGLICWVSEIGGIENIVQSDVFLPGYNYSLYITIERNSENCTFAENCVVTVNGKPVEVERAEAGQYVLFIYDFGNAENTVDNPLSFLEIIEGYIKEFFKKIHKFVAALFGHTIY